jgi:hypothetical protein
VDGEVGLEHWHEPPDEHLRRLPIAAAPEMGVLAVELVVEVGDGVGDVLEGDWRHGVVVKFISGYTMTYLSVR